jgi:senataxin
MGTISPVTVAEQIFASQGFERVLSQFQSLELAETSPAIAWIPDFISSLPAVHQFDACRSLLFHLLERLQDSHFPEPARLACCRAGLSALGTTLNTFLKSDYQINPSTSLIVINDIMGLVNQSIDTIVGCASLDADDDKHRELKRLGMIVVRDALALDCKALNSEYHALYAHTPIQRVHRNHSQAVWTSVLEIFRPGDLELAKIILAATTTLVGLDELLPDNKKTPTAMPPDHIQFNKDFKQLNDNISRVFERLSDFSPSDLRQLYETQQTARPLFAALVSADQATYEAAVEVIKALTGESGKQEAMKSLLEQAFSPFLTSIAFAVSRISKNHAFSPVPYMLKIGKDTLNALCGNTGVLRTRSTLSSGEQNSVLGWWTIQWRALEAVFSTFEVWGARVHHSTDYLQELIRDGMEYSNALFDSHTVLASSISEANHSLTEHTSLKSASSKDSVTKVLNTICHNVNGLTGMLRLRDAYLISIITRLLVKLLRCLGEFNLEIDDQAIAFIKDACKGEKQTNFKKTNLTSTQKAELQRALDEHQGVQLIESPAPVIKKQSTIDSWSKSAGGQKYEPSFPATSKSTLAQDLNLTSSKHRSMLDQLRAENKMRPKSLQKDSSKPNSGQGQVNIAQRRQLELEKKQRDAAAVAHARSLRNSTLVKGEGSGLKGIGGELNILLFMFITSYDEFYRGIRNSLTNCVPRYRWQRPRPHSK